MARKHRPRTLASALWALALTSIAPTLCAAQVGKANLFSPEECVAVQDYWAAPGRYTVKYVQADKKGAPWQAVYTAAGSEWLYHYYKLRSKSRLLPTANPSASDPKSKS